MYSQTRQMIGELRSIESRTRRQWEVESVERANSRDYNLSQESKDALARGDRQRLTGVYQTETNESVCYAEMSNNGPFGVHICSLDKGHIGSHQCVAVGYCNTTWD